MFSRYNCGEINEQALSLLFRNTSLYAYAFVREWIRKSFIRTRWTRSRYKNMLLPLRNKKKETGQRFLTCPRITGVLAPSAHARNILSYYSNKTYVFPRTFIHLQRISRLRKGYRPKQSNVRTFWRVPIQRRVLLGKSAARKNYLKGLQGKRKVKNRWNASKRNSKTRGKSSFNRRGGNVENRLATTTSCRLVVQERSNVTKQRPLNTRLASAVASRTAPKTHTWHGRRIHTW